MLGRLTFEKRSAERSNSHSGQNATRVNTMDLSRFAESRISVATVELETSSIRIKLDATPCMHMQGMISGAFARPTKHEHVIFFS